MVAGEPGSVPAAAHPALCLRLPNLAACQILGAHAHIQAFRRLRARFLNEQAGTGAWSESNRIRKRYNLGRVTKVFVGVYDQPAL